MKKPASSLNLVQATVASVSLLGLSVLQGQSAHAKEDPVPAAPKAWEKCYGVSRSGLNDCSSLDGKHGCGGHSFVDGDLNEYIWVPLGTCLKIVNGTTHGQASSKIRKTRCEKKCIRAARQNNN